MKINEIILERTSATPLGSLKNQPGFTQGFISGLVPGSSQAFQASRRDRITTATPYDAPIDANADATSGNTTSSTDNISPDYQRAEQQAQQLAQRAAEYKPRKLGQVTNSRDQASSYDVTYSDGSRGIVRVGYKDDQGRDVPSRVSATDPATKQPYSYSYDNTTREWRKVGSNEIATPELTNNLNTIIQDVGQQVQQINAKTQAQQTRASNLQKSRQTRKQRIAGQRGTPPQTPPASPPEPGTT
jgi:hypothetical protein